MREGEHPEFELYIYDSDLDKINDDNDLDDFLQKQMMLVLHENLDFWWDDDFREGE